MWLRGRPDAMDRTPQLVRSGISSRVADGMAERGEYDQDRHGECGHHSDEETAF
jgi:hypothetical protein